MSTTITNVLIVQDDKLIQCGKIIETLTMDGMTMTMSQRFEKEEDEVTHDVLMNKKIISEWQS